jgi:glycosyltransferase involved in cell wall biosynthesis
MILTIFTPTYNRAHTLHRVYESIRNQTLKKVDGKYMFEWIVVDDGSTDKTTELIGKWQKESDFPIRYFYQENHGKPYASRKGIEEARGELFLFADSDDAFLPKTFETFYKVWQNFSDEERRLCGGIGVLCQDQDGNRIGCDYPIEKRLLPALDTVMKWRHIGLGETWAVLKTENLKRAFSIPKEAEHLKFIPESFFWDRILFGMDTYSYFLNKPLRIYYRNEKDAISQNVRKIHGESFLFESRWFLLHYYPYAWRYPKIFFRHLLKYLYYSMKVRNNVSKR